MLQSALIKVLGSDKKNIQFSVKGQTFELNKRYKLDDILEQGGSSVLVSAIDSLAEDLSDNQVVVKKSSQIFKDKEFSKRILRESKILRLLQNDNILGIRSFQMPERL